MTDATTDSSPEALATTPEVAPIPKLLHLIWVGPHDPPAECIKSWEVKHPKWIVSVWKDHTEAAGWENKEQIAKRAARGEWNGVADVMRLELLWRCGGVAVDADSECLIPLDDGPIDFLSNKGAIACYESETVRPGMIACGFLGAPRGHKFFRTCIDDAMRADPNDLAWRTVGPLLVTRVAQALLKTDPEAIKVYPSKMFCPEHYSGAKAPGDHPIYARQHWGSSTSYNKLRKWPCQCQVCRNTHTALRPPWG